MLPSLSEYIAQRVNQAKIRPDYENENVIWAIQDYLSMKGEFDSDDLKTIYDHGFCAGDFVCDEDTPDEVVKCVRCGYQTDVEGDVMKSDGRCPRCGDSTIVVYGKER